MLTRKIIKKEGVELSMKPSGTLKSPSPPFSRTDLESPEVQGVWISKT